ncbi:unnamed protein product [Zymoseptoria tritici ST99CH_3D7]|uniref:Uncharacterized protein n=2 Tax=Zymoseptoria tritici TaxID=1047171 RepID=F9XH11_ZYMTI|nr:uncharacterized protein MYCGRDRAFT_95395 [Zymoseptoria tritici IPO323]EGP85223.1 hypothetical protein MYCGRDRAFT_95395 [Zymoseptoria tritici IPO323]SMQ53658.1 unnamed protein product [Zymoseptoria tritici ST99CH_3D7]
MSAPSAFEKAQAAAAKIAAKVSKQQEQKFASHTKRKIENFASNFHATLEVNHLTTLARLAATSAGTIAQVSNTGGALTVRGKFYSGNSQPASARDEPKLNVFVEGMTEAIVRAAMALVGRYIQEGVIKDRTASAREKASRDEKLLASVKAKQRQKEDDRAREDPYGAMGNPGKDKEDRDLEAVEPALGGAQAVDQTPILLKWQTSWAGEIMV